MEPGGGGNVYEEARANGVGAAAANRELEEINENALDGPEVQPEDFVGPPGEYSEEEEERKYFRRKRLGVIKNLVAASMGGMLTYGVFLGLLQMQLILHYDETYREVKYSNLELQNIDSKMLMGINVTPIAALLYTPLLIRFFGTKWMLFLAVGIYALFVSTNYWERYYTLVPSAVAIGVAIVPLWASMGNYITRMAQKYYEYANYKLEHVQNQRRAPHGAYNSYIIVFQTVFYGFFYLSFVCAQFPMFFFLTPYLYDLKHTLCNVEHCGTNSHGILTGFNTTVLQKLPRSSELITVESVLMGIAFFAMLLVLIFCGSAYRPTEEIDLRSIGWGNIFQLPFKHMRDYRLRHLFLFFIYSGFEMVFVCTGFTLNYGVCSIGLERMAFILTAYGLSSAVCCTLGLSMLWLPRQAPLVAGAVVHGILLIALFCWEPKAKSLAEEYAFYVVAGLWGLGSALNKTGLSALLGILYEDKERQDFIFTIYHWCQALAIFVVYLWSGLPMKVTMKLGILIFIFTIYHWCQALAIFVVYLWSGLPMKVTMKLGILVFIFTIYHWCQALAIFVVYLWSDLPMKAKLSILLLVLIAAVFFYLWMERKIGQLIPHRLPKIPRPRHKTRGYRYLEENSEESDSEGEEGESSEEERDGEELNGHQDQPRRRNRAAYEQAQEDDQVG